jgi:hypothetical protein
LITALNLIRTFTEEKSAGVMQQIDHALRDAQVSLVLGFGFHVQNVEMLSTSRDYAPNPTFMTAYGIGANSNAVTKRLQDALKSNVAPTVMDTVAMGLMYQLKPSISLAVS